MTSPRENKKSGLLSKLWNGTKWGIAVGYGLLQAVNLTNDISNYLNPSKERLYFRERYNVELIGWKEDVEENPAILKSLDEVLDREMSNGIKPKLSSIRINSQNILKRNVISHFGFLVGWEVPLAMHNFLINEIEIEGSTDLCESHSRFHHECKHAKVKAVKKRNQSFYKEWKNIAKEGKENNPYRGNLFYLIYSYNKTLADDIFHWFRSSASEGSFVSEYAKTRIGEDIAELGMQVETNPNLDISNETLIKKIEFAEKIGLIPRGYSEFRRLDYSPDEQSIVKAPFNNNPDIARAFLKESKKFLKKYPRSIYEARVRMKRGDAFTILAQNKLDYYQNALDEYSKVTLTRTDYIEQEFHKRAERQIISLNNSPMRERYIEFKGRLCYNSLSNLIEINLNLN